MDTEKRNTQEDTLSIYLQLIKEQDLIPLFFPYQRMSYQIQICEFLF